MELKMKTIFTNSLSLILCAELLLAPFPKAARAQASSEEFTNFDSPPKPSQSGTMEQNIKTTNLLLNPETGS